MTEMVERVARAIVAELEDQQLGTRSPWDDPNFRDNALRVARAAIEAMREPTNKMVNGVYGRFMSGDNPARSATSCWQAMIDEALS